MPTINPTSETSLFPNRATYKGRFNSDQNYLKPKSSPPSIRGLCENDIVCGRGAPAQFHKGNKKFRELILQYQSAYLFSKRPDKPRLAWKLLDIITSNGGRFVRRVKGKHLKTTGGGTVLCWEQLNERKAYDKICQSLREGAPELRRRILRRAANDMQNRGVAEK